MSKSIPYVIKDEDGKFTVRPAQGFVPKNVIGIVPDDIAFEDWRYVTAKTSTDPSRDWDITVDTALRDSELQVAAQKMQAEASYHDMIKDIYDMMYTLFQTKDNGSLTADHESWKKMVAAPAKFVSVGIKVRADLKQVSGELLYAAGTVLDDEAKITAFATRKLEQAEEYAVYRAQRKQIYLDEKS